MKASIFFASVFAMVFSLQSACGQAADGVGTKAPSPLPTIEQFQLDGERWSCMADGKPLTGLLLKPEGEGPFPGIVLSHGLGGQAQGIMWNRGRTFRSWGFVCIATDYTHAGKERGGRLRPGDVDFTQAGARPENIRRAMACLAILLQQKMVDPKRIGAYGHSMGAFVTIALSGAAPHRIAAAAITSGGIATEDYQRSSAPTAAVAAKVRAPFLILQGETDTTVPPESSEQFRQVLEQHDVPSERHVFEGVGHNVPSERTAEMNQFMRDWFMKHGLLLPAENEEEQPGEESQVTP